MDAPLQTNHRWYASAEPLFALRLDPCAVMSRSCWPCSIAMCSAGAVLDLPRQYVRRTIYAGGSTRTWSAGSRWGARSPA